MEFSPSTTNNAAPAANQVIQGTIELQGTLKGDIRAFDTQKIDPKGTIAINGGEAIFTHYNEDVYGSTVKVYGAMWQDDDDDSTVYITDLASALADASAAGITEVMVVGLNGCSDRSNEVRGSYVVDSDITLPADMNLSVNCGLIINEGVSMTIPSTAGISFEGTWSIVYVNGKLIDYDTISQTTALSKIGFEVMSSVESGEDVINTYTSFATALSETTEGTIYLYDNIVIDRNMTIPENVTVQYADVKGVTGTISFKPDTKYTFTVDGTLFLTNGHNFVTTGGTVVVNNVIKFDDLTTVGSADGTPEVNGAYFTATLGDDADPYAYITSVAFAAENSSSIDNTNSDDNIITIFGNVAMGNATFTLGADVQSLTVAIYNNGNDKATGDITLVGNVTFSTAGSNNYEGTFDGTITTDVSAGNVVINLDNVNDVIIKVVSTEGADGTVTSVEMFSNTENQNVNQIDGTVTIESGEVTIPTKTMVDKLVVSQSATLNVDADLVVVVNPNYKFNTTSSSLPVFTEEFIANAAGLVVDGNMVIDKNANVEAIIAHVGGTVTVTDGFFYAYLSCVDGTIAAAEDGSSQLAVALLNGTVSGDAVFEAVIAFPGSDITGADVTAPNSADIQSTVIYVNGAEFGTYYAKDGVAIESVLLAMDVDGVKIDTADFCTDADMRNSFTDLTSTEDADILTDLDDVIKAVQGIKDTASLNNVKTKLNSIEGTSVGTYTEVYIGMEPADVTGTITVYEGMNLYIDGQAISNFMKQVGDKYVYVLPVGTHQFSVQVDPGFTGTPVVTLDGQTVTGSFTISNDAQSFQIVVTGDIAQDIPTTGSSDDGMGLTDYLLIILVVLIVIMAIMVAMRLMRS